MEQPQKDYKKPAEPAVNSYARWSGLAFQMLGAILLGVFGGIWLDKKLEMSFPAFTLGLSLLGVVASLWIVIKQVMGMNK